MARDNVDSLGRGGSTRSKGKWGEEIAIKYLEKEGYIILEKNYAHRFGEIDIIARNEEYIVFVEVKYRKSLKNGYPREAVGFRKQEKIRNTALAYIAEKDIKDSAMRFDVIEIIDKDLEHIKNAF